MRKIDTYRNFKNAYEMGYFEDELSQSEYLEELEALEYAESWEGMWGLPTENPWDAVDADLDDKKKKGEW